MRTTLVASTLAVAQLATALVPQWPLGVSNQLPLEGVDDSSSPSIASASDAPSYREALLKLHENLVSFKSTSGDEYMAAGYLFELFYNMGWLATMQVVPDRPGSAPVLPRMNVIAWPDTEGNPEPKVLLTSHVDTVPPHISYSIDEGDITKDTRIWGRGSADAKASVAAMITAVVELLEKEEIKNDDVMLAFVVGEEVAGDGMRYFSNWLKTVDAPPHFESVVFGEPTEGKLACGHKGALFCKIKAQGVAAHSGYPWLGKSATELLVRAMDRIFDADLGSSEKYGNTTVNLGTLSGGIAANVVSEEAQADIAIRVAIGPEKEGANIVRDQIQKIVNEVDDEAFTIDCSQGYGFVESECEVDGFESIVVNYGTDIPNLEGDHTRYLYGPGSILVAHGPNEHITVGDLEKAVEDYQKLILHALKQ
ncbi:hypothetical protein N3K66_000041 [Trichothecium roseum]|uniref:Uncharacterized protein n=1 Tax=Trichothecium roseum TaxID=47278 RepID=A0ACC0VAU5_9HYPO|nr:hypothetical protein N3K66_000041 [Trichothecium roseum]